MRKSSLMLIGLIQLGCNQPEELATTGHLAITATGVECIVRLLRERPDRDQFTYELDELFDPPLGAKTVTQVLAVEGRRGVIDNVLREVASSLCFPHAASVYSVDSDADMRTMVDRLRNWPEGVVPFIEFTPQRHSDNAPVILLYGHSAPGDRARIRGGSLNQQELEELIERGEREGADVPQILRDALRDAKLQLDSQNQVNVAQVREHHT